MKVMQAREQAETLLEVEIANRRKEVLVTGSMRSTLCFILQIVDEICCRETR